MKRVFIFIIAFILIERFTYFQTGGFSPYKILCDKELVIKSKNQADPSAEKILDQPFFYLGKGVQFFAFLSKDQKYVLKCIKHHPFSPRFWFSGSKKDLRLQKIMQSCEIAYTHIKEGTGLVALHLQPDPHEQRFVTLFDNLGIEHKIDINQTSFILQERAEEFDKHPLTQHDVDALILLIKKRINQGILNSDPRVRNFGFLHSQPIEIDLGSFIKSEDAYTSLQSLQMETLEIKKWLDKYDSSLSDYLVEKIQDEDFPISSVFCPL